MLINLNGMERLICKIRLRSNKHVSFHISFSSCFHSLFKCNNRLLFSNKRDPLSIFFLSLIKFRSWVFSQTPLGLVTSMDPFNAPCHPKCPCSLSQFFFSHSHNFFAIMLFFLCNNENCVILLFKFFKNNLKCLLHQYDPDW